MPLSVHFFPESWRNGQRIPIGNKWHALQIPFLNIRWDNGPKHGVTFLFVNICGLGDDETSLTCETRPHAAKNLKERNERYLKQGLLYPSCCDANFCFLEYESGYSQDHVRCVCRISHSHSRIKVLNTWLKIFEIAGGREQLWMRQ